MGLESAHFKESELYCPHCGQNEISQDALDMAEQFRTAVGSPVIVNSAYRCRDHNREVGGEPDSQHVLGRALDVRVQGKTAAQLEEIADSCPLIKGVGRSDERSYLHIDCRLTGVPVAVKWCYADGKQCAYYPPA